MENKNWLTRIHHITYPCRPDTVEKWVRFHTEVEGGEIIYSSPDLCPDYPHSSIKLWCIGFGEFIIDLIVGIDREGKSHVTEFVERHGDHCVQHIAFETTHLEEYIEHLKKHGVKPLAPMVTNLEPDGFNHHIFTKGYSGEGIKNMPFSEYMQIIKVEMTDENCAQIKEEHKQSIKEDLYVQSTESAESEDRGTLFQDLRNMRPIRELGREAKPATVG